MGLDCENVRDLLSLYKAGELSPSSVKAVDAHLAGCQSCARFYEQQKDFVEMLGNLETKKPSKVLDKELAERIYSFRLRLLKVLVVLAVLLLLIGFAFPVLQSLYVKGQRHEAALERVEAALIELHSAVTALQLDKPALASVDLEAELVSGNWWEENRRDYYSAIEIFGDEIQVEAIANFISLLYLRQQHGVISERDRQALARMDEFLSRYVRDLADIRRDLAGRLNKFWLPDTRMVEDMAEEIYLLSRAYTLYNLLPDEALSQNQVEQRVARLTGVAVENVIAEPYQSYWRMPMWSFSVLGAGEVEFRGVANGYTGSIISIEPAVAHRRLQVQGDAGQAILDMARQVFAPELELAVVGEVPASRNDLVQSAWIQIRPRGYPVYEGDRALVYYSILPGSDKINIHQISLERTMANVDLYSLLELGDMVPVLAPAQALAQIETGKEWQYTETVFIRSLLSGELVLVHKYTCCYGELSLFIDAATGRRELPLFQLPQIHWTFNFCW